MSDGDAFRRMLPRDEFRMSELPDHLDVSSIPDDERAIHTLFAILLNDVDRSDMSQDMKPDVLEGLVQAWTYFARECVDGDVDMAVDIHRHGLDTEVIESGE